MSIEFCSDYRKDMEEWIENGTMSPRLSNELLSLERIPITEEGAEGMHAGLSRSFRAAGSAKLAWVASTARLEQNIALTEASSMACVASSCQGVCE